MPEMTSQKSKRADIYLQIKQLSLHTESCHQVKYCINITQISSSLIIDVGVRASDTEYIFSKIRKM